MDNEVPVLILNLILEDLVSFLNVGKQMNAGQLLETVRLILSDHILRSMKPDDFKLISERIKKGYYGKQYDRFDGQVFLQCCFDYANERQAEHEFLAIAHHQSRDQREKSQPTNPEGQKKVMEILKQYAEVKEVKIKQPVIKNSREIYIQTCFRAFYRLWKRKPYGSTKGVQFVERRGSVMNEEEYVKFRLTRYDLLLMGKA